MTLVESLLAVATEYAKARKLSLSRVSTLVFGDGKILDRLHDGKDLTTRRHEAAMVWFSGNWPADAVWPDAVSRPAPAPSEAAA